MSTSTEQTKTPEQTTAEQIAAMQADIERLNKDLNTVRQNTTPTPIDDMAAVGGLFAFIIGCAVVGIAVGKKVFPKEKN